MFGQIVTESGLSQVTWARRLGISEGYLSDLVNGKRRPSLAVAAAIERATGGRVTATSWFDPSDTPNAEDAA